MGLYFCVCYFKIGYEHYFRGVHSFILIIAKTADYRLGDAEHSAEYLQEITG